MSDRASNPSRPKIDSIYVVSPGKLGSKAMEKSQKRRSILSRKAPIGWLRAGSHLQLLHVLTEGTKGERELVVSRGNWNIHNGCYW